MTTTQLSEPVRKIYDGLKFKSVDEAMKSLDKLKAEQKTHLDQMKGEGGVWETAKTTPEQRLELEKRNLEIAAVNAYVAQQNEFKQYDDAAQFGYKPASQGMFGNPLFENNSYKSIGQKFAESEA